MAADVMYAVGGKDFDCLPVGAPERKHHFRARERLVSHGEQQHPSMLAQPRQIRRADKLAALLDRVAVKMILRLDVLSQILPDALDVLCAQNIAAAEIEVGQFREVACAERLDKD